jgi:hypothetical protein
MDPTDPDPAIFVTDIKDAKIKKKKVAFKLLLDPYKMNKMRNTAAKLANVKLNKSKINLSL